MSTKTGSQTDRRHITLDDLGQRAEIAIPSYITVTQAAASLPPGRNGRPTHISTIIRWITTGTISPAGETVHLRAVRMGGRWLTTREWLDDYARRLTPVIGEREASPAASVHRRSAERASRELDAIGI